MKYRMKLLFLFYIGIYTTPTYSQKNLVVDNFEYGLTYYDGCSKTISSISVIPSIVAENIDKYIKQSFGNLSSVVHFSHGQIVDIKNYFKKNTDTYNMKWLVPKYDLQFILQDSTIGIKSFLITLRVDEYGQILYCNWPREGYGDKNKFKRISEIEKYALKVASKKGFNVNDYIVSLNYNEKNEKMCWEFQFRKKGNEKEGLYDAFEIDWIYLEVIDEYEVKKQTVN